MRRYLALALVIVLGYGLRSLPGGAAASARDAQRTATATVYPHEHCPIGAACVQRHKSVNFDGLPTATPTLPPTMRYPCRWCPF